MNGPEIQKLIHEDLQRAVARAGDPPAQERSDMTRWLASSLLQKAIRRGRDDLARLAAATMLQLDYDRLWRRLACIAVEDIGVASLEAVGVATAASAGKRKRADAGGDWPVASAVIGVLCAAPKCRAADDLLMITQLLPELEERWADLRDREDTELIDIVIGDGEIADRALALSVALTSGRQRSYTRPRVRRVTEPVFDRLCEAGWPHSLVETVRINFNRTGVLLAPLVALLSGVLPDDTRIEPDPKVSEIMIDDVPGWAFDAYSFDGLWTLSEFLDGASATAKWMHRHVGESDRRDALAHAVFRVEGGLVDRRLRWPLSDRLRREVDVGCMGIDRAKAEKLLELVWEDIPALNEARARIKQLS